MSSSSLNCGLSRSRAEISSLFEKHALVFKKETCLADTYIAVKYIYAIMHFMQLILSEDLPCVKPVLSVDEI